MTKLFTRLMTLDEPDVTFSESQKLCNLSKQKKEILRTELTIRQGFLCCYCKKKVTLRKPIPGNHQGMYATFEHTVDVFSGNGQKDERLSTIKIACHPCNAKRGSEENERAIRYYKQFFFKKNTFRQFLQHPKVGWEGIIREFGPIPPDF